MSARAGGGLWCGYVMGVFAPSPRSGSGDADGGKPTRAGGSTSRPPSPLERSLGPYLERNPVTCAVARSQERAYTCSVKKPLLQADKQVQAGPWLHWFRERKETIPATGLRCTRESRERHRRKRVQATTSTIDQGLLRLRLHLGKQQSSVVLATPRLSPFSPRVTGSMHVRHAR